MLQSCGSETAVHGRNVRIWTCEVDRGYGEHDEVKRDIVRIFLDRERRWRERLTPDTSDEGGSLWSGAHETLPLRGHQDETLREDRVPRGLPGGPSERLPCTDDPPLEILRRLAERGRCSRLWPDKSK